MRRRQIVLLVATVWCAAALTACGSSSKDAASTISTVPPGTPEFAPRPEDTMDLAAAAGIVVDSSEHLDFHEHATLQMTVDGEPVAVPANIGVGTTSIAELHTHDASGTLHLEAAGEITDGSFDLGHFFDTWGVTLDENCVGEHCRPDATIAFTVDGQPYTGNPREIALRDGVEIQISIS
jgi:hypothetical protein